MNTEDSIGQLLRWRVSQAEAEAPPAPRAARLLELARPWWESVPAAARALFDRLGAVQLAYGHAQAVERLAHAGYPVQALIVRANGEEEAFARILYLNVRDGRLRMRFQFEQPFAGAEQGFEVTFVSGSPPRPLFSAQASLSVDGEYRLDADVSDEIAQNWAPLKVTDQMPFRLILHAR